MQRDTVRYDKMKVEDVKQDQRIETKKHLYKAGAKNQGGAAFNIVTLTYDNTQEGKLLSNLDNDAMVRALMRSKVLDQKNNGHYNILTGEQRQPIPVPHHDRYNPMTRAGEAVLGSRRSFASVENGSRRSQAAPGQEELGSRRSGLPPSQRSGLPPSQRSGLPPSQRSGLPPSQRSLAPSAYPASHQSMARESSHSRIFGN